MKNLLRTFAMACMLTVFALMSSTTEVAAQPPGPCDVITIAFADMNTATVGYPLRVDLGLVNSVNGDTSTVIKTLGPGSGFVTPYNSPSQPRNVTQMVIRDAWGNASVINFWGSNPQTIPTIVPGKCLKVGWSGCVITIQEVDC